MKIKFVAPTIVVGLAFHLFGVDQPNRPPSPKATSTAKEQWKWSIDVPAFVGCEDGLAQPNFLFTPAPAPTPCGETPDTVPNDATATGTELSGATSEVGTIIVLGFSKAKVVLAADSRNTLYRGGVFAGYDDTACKLIEVTPTLLFAADGHTGIKGPGVPADVEYDAQELARLAEKSVKTPKGQSRVYSIAQRWAWDLDSRVRHGFKMRLLSGDSDTFLEGIFAGLEPNGDTNVVIARLQYSPRRSGATGPPVQLSFRSPQSRPATFTWLEPFGMSDFAGDLISQPQTTDKAKSDHAVIEKERLGNPLLFSPSVPVKLVSLTIQHYETLASNAGYLFVHGPIDVAVIERRKTARWIRWKGCSGRQTARPPKHKPQTTSK